MARILARELKSVTFGKKQIAFAVLLIIFLGLLAVFYHMNPASEIYTVKAKNKTIENIIQKHPRISVEGHPDVFLEYPRLYSEKRYAALKSSLDAIRDHNKKVLQMAPEDEVFPVWVRLLDQQVQNITVEEENTTTQDTDDAESSSGVPRKPDVRQGVTALTNAEFEKLSTPGSMNQYLSLNSIILALIILTPLIFISTAHNNSFFSEKISKRASLLFMSPVSKLRLIAGKTSAYFIPTFLVIFIAMIIVKPRFEILYALPPIFAVMLLYFSLNNLLTTLSNNYKDMSFFKTTLGTIFISYLLLPTLFAGISDVAYISPLTTVVESFQGDFPGLKKYIFSFLPMLFTSIIIYYFSSLMFNEENYFATKPITKKIADMLSIFLKRPRNIFFLTILFYPLIIVIELIFVMLVLLPGSNFLLVLIPVAAITEEIFKNIGIYLVYKRRLFRASPLKLAIYSGAGFALAEKLMVLVMIPALISAYSKIVIGFILFPFIFHSLTCLLFAFLVKRYRSFYLVLIPIVVHIVYNLVVMVLAT